MPCADHKNPAANPPTVPPVRATTLRSARLSVGTTSAEKKDNEGQTVVSNSTPWSGKKELKKLVEKENLEINEGEGHNAAKRVFVRRHDER